MDENERRTLARKLHARGIPTWQIAIMLKTTEAKVVSYVRDD